jgi:hypothetical protein
MMDGLRKPKLVGFPIEYTCPQCGDTASHSFATEAARDQFSEIWDREHPNTPHPSIAKTQEKIEAKRRLK